MRILGLGMLLLAACEGKGGHGGGGWGHSSGGGGGGGGGGWSHSSSSGNGGGGGGGGHSAPTLASSSASHVAHYAHESTGAKIGQAAAGVAEGVVAGVLDAAANNEGAVVIDSSPLIDNHDPCNYCPEDMQCGQCLGVNDALCQFAPAGAYSRCASPGL